MPTKLCSLVALLALLAALPISAPPPSSSQIPTTSSLEQPPTDDDFAPGEVLVRWRGECCPAANEIDGLVSDAWVEDGVQHLHVPPGTETAMVRALQARDQVEWAQLDYERKLLENPDDPRFGEQWALQRIHVPEAWDVTTGDPAVIVAVIDTGVDLGHPDLADRLVDGYNFLAPDTPPQDDLGHGTHAAGTIAATMNNHIGVAGVAPGVTIMPLKALTRRGIGRDSTVATAIRYAADHGAWVINMSFGGKAESPVLTDAVAYASERGVALVVAAGNDGRSQPSYPAATLPAIAVAATNVDDARPSYSNYGSWVHVSAPGQSIVSTYWDADNGSSYRSFSGTSMAAPHVAGIVALMYSVRPDLTVDQIDSVLKATADQLGGVGMGAGRVNAARAVKAVASGAPITTPASAPTDQPASPTPRPTAVPTATPIPMITILPANAQPAGPRNGPNVPVPPRATSRAGISGGGSVPR